MDKLTILGPVAVEAQGVRLARARILPGMDKRVLKVMTGSHFGGPGSRMMQGMWKPQIHKLHRAGAPGWPAGMTATTT